MEYGARAEDLGFIDLPDIFGIYVLYMPIKMKYSEEFRLPYPLNSDKIIELSLKCDYDYGNTFNKYIYLSYECSYVRKGITQKRPGWHSDGFKTDDINYIWHSNTPTLFNFTKFNISNDHNVSMEEFEQQANPINNFKYENKKLLKMNQYVVHKADIPDTSGIRTFVKISISDDKYNLKGNTHNPEFDYNWKMYDRSKVRNHPQIKEVDSVPDDFEFNNK